MEDFDDFDMHQEERLWPTLPDDGDIMEPEGDTLPDDWDDGDDEGSLDNFEDDGDALASAGFGTDEDY